MPWVPVLLGFGFKIPCSAGIRGNLFTHSNTRECIIYVTLSPQSQAHMPIAGHLCDTSWRRKIYYVLNVLQFKWHQRSLTHELGCCGHADCTRLLTSPFFLSIPLTTLTKEWAGWYVAGWHQNSCSFCWCVSLFPYLCQLCYFDQIVVLAVDRHQLYDSIPENWLRVVYFTPLTLSQLALPSLTRGVATEPWCLHLLAGKLLFRFISCGCNRFKWFMMKLQTIHSILWCSLGISWPRMQGNRVEVDIFHPSPCVRAHQCTNYCFRRKPEQYVFPKSSLALGHMTSCCADNGD